MAERQRWQMMQVSQEQVAKEPCRVSVQQPVSQTPCLIPKSASSQPAKLDPISTRSTSARKPAKSKSMSAFSFKHTSSQQQQQPVKESSHSNKQTELGPGRDSCRTGTKASQTSLLAESPKIDSRDDGGVAWKEKGNAAFKQGRWEAAVQAYTR